MKTTPWIDVQQEFTSASRHFRLAVELYIQGGFNAPAQQGYRARMVFMDAMLAGQASLETGLRNILAECEEEIPSGLGSDGVLLQRAGCATSKRSPILEVDTLLWALATEHFRDFVCKGAQCFVNQSVSELVMAAWLLSQRLVPGYLRFLKMPCRFKNDTLNKKLLELPG